jgi:hypothetical protein
MEVVRNNRWGVWGKWGKRGSRRLDNGSFAVCETLKCLPVIQYTGLVALLLRL